MIPGKKEAIDRKFRMFIEDKYSFVLKDAEEKIIDSLITWMELAMDRKQPLKTVLEQAAKLIFRQFEFREVGIGLKSRTSETYKYEVLFGYKREIVDSFLELEYTLDDMVSQDRFPYIKMGRRSELNPAEGLPDEERILFNRPYQLTARRVSMDDFLEGDYLDIWMYGPNKELIGWFELANPVNGKLPTRRTIRWIELIAGVCSSVVLQRWAEEDLGRR